MSRKYEKAFIIIGVVVTIAMALTGFVIWVKHSLKFIVDDLDDIFGETDKEYEPEVVIDESDDDDDEYGDICD